MIARPSKSDFATVAYLYVFDFQLTITRLMQKAKPTRHQQGDGQDRVGPTQAEPADGGDPRGGAALCSGALASLTVGLSVRPREAAAYPSLLRRG